MLAGTWYMARLLCFRCPINLWDIGGDKCALPDHPVDPSHSLSPTSSSLHHPTPLSFPYHLIPLPFPHHLTFLLIIQFLSTSPSPDHLPTPSDTPPPSTPPNISSANVQAFLLASWLPSSQVFHLELKNLDSVSMCSATQSTLLTYFHHSQKSIMSLLTSLANPWPGILQNIAPIVINCTTVHRFQ